MTDPFTIIGTAASLVQLVQGVAKGLLNLRNAIKAVKDVHDKIQALSNQIQQITHPIVFIQTYMKTRPADIGYELFIVIDNVTKSCHACLEKFQSQLPVPPKAGRSHHKIDAAIRIWINNHDLEETRRHIDGYVQNLSLIMAVLNLFKVDQVDAKLDAISQFLKETVQYRSVNNRSIASGVDPEALEINVKIRAVANHLATSIAMKEPNIAPRKAKPHKTSISSATTGENDDSQILLPVVRPEREQLNHELEANRSALNHLREYQLYESAVEIQRRAMKIKEFLAPDAKLWPKSVEYHEMQEVLADILLQCDSEDCRQEALAILQSEVCRFSNETNGAFITTEHTSTQTPQKLVGLHLKIGKAYQETGQSDVAMTYLRKAFNECNKLSPKDSKILQTIGEHLLEVYEYQVQDGDDSQRAVRITQLQGFRKEFEIALGRPFTDCTEAISWFDNASIVVPRGTERYRFDIVDQESSTSPLHIAAERCRDPTVLQQIIENSDTLENHNGENETPLLVAVEHANTDAVALLIKNGASVKARDKEQQTVLHKNQKPPVIRVLLHSRNRRTSSVSDCSRTGSETHFGRVSSSSSAATTTTNTTYSNLPPSEDAILSDLEIDSQDAYQQTPLWTACSTGRAKTVNLLLAAGADPNKARYGTTPLVAVIDSIAHPYLRDPGKRVRIVEALVHAGADPVPGREALQHRSRGTDYKRLVRALESSWDRSLLSPTSTGFLTLQDFPKLEL